MCFADVMYFDPASPNGKILAAALQRAKEMHNMTDERVRKSFPISGLGPDCDALEICVAAILEIPQQDRIRVAKAILTFFDDGC